MCPHIYAINTLYINRKLNPIAENPFGLYTSVLYIHPGYDVWVLYSRANVFYKII